MTTLPFLLIIGMGNGCLPSRSPLSSCSGNFRGSFRTTAMATTIMRSQVWCWNVRTAQVPTLNLQNCATPELSSSRRVWTRGGEQEKGFKYRSLQLEAKALAGGVVALGKFDALHVGHRALAEHAAELGPPFLVSFAGMAEVLGWEVRLPVVARCDRARVMGLWAKHCGGMVPQEYMLDFAKVRSLSPEQFVEKLASELKVKGVVAGANYRFGYKAAGDAWDQTSRSPCTRALSSGVFWKRERGVHSSGGSISRSFYAASVRNEQYERNGSTCAETSPEGSRSSGARPLQPPHLQSSLVADDFWSLILSKKREVAILEAALEILEIAPRDKRIEDLVRKHNIFLEPRLGDRLVRSNIQFEPVSTVEPTSQVVGASKVKNNFVENDVLDLEPGKPFDNQQDRRWNTAQVPSPKMDSTMFGKLSLDDFPSPQDPNFERLQKKRRRQELMKEHERSSKIESLNFGAASKSAVGDSNPREESAVDPLRPNAIAFLEQPDKKPYRSLADRLYEEQFGRPAPPGLKRTYPKGSFYDRCMKEKEQKERDAASASAAPSSRRM